MICCWYVRKTVKRRVQAREMVDRLPIPWRERPGRNTPATLRDAPFACSSRRSGTITKTPDTRTSRWRQRDRKSTIQPRYAKDAEGKASLRLTKLFPSFAAKWQYVRAGGVRRDM